MVGHALTEAFGVFYTTLKSANARHSAGIFKNINIVVVSEPNELTFVVGKHLKLGFHLIGNVYVFGRLATEKTGVVHIVNGNYVASFAELRLIVRNSSRKSRLENKLRGFYMVAHIIVGGLSNDKVGLCFANNFNQLVVLCLVGRVNEKVAYVAGYNLKSYRFSRFLCFADTDSAKLVSLDNNVTHIAVGNVTNGNVVTSLLAAKKSSSATDLHIIGMT